MPTPRISKDSLKNNKREVVSGTPRREAELIHSKNDLRISKVMESLPLLILLRLKYRFMRSNFGNLRAKQRKGLIVLQFLCFLWRQSISAGLE